MINGSYSKASVLYSKTKPLIISRNYVFVNQLLFILLLP